MSVGMMSELSSAPILEAIENYRGSFVDLGRATVVDAAAFATGHRKLTKEIRLRGVTSGDRVILAIANGPQFPAALAALLANDASPILLHWQTPPQEILRTARQYGAKFVIADGEQRSGLAEVTRRTVSLAADSWLHLAWGEFDETAPDFNANWTRLPGVPLHPTSGTTARPKVAARPGFCATEEARHYIERIEIDDRDVILATPPMSHAYAYGMCVMVPMLSGARVVSMRSFKPNLALHALRELDVSIFPAVPAMLDLLTFAAPQGAGRPPRCVLTAGSPMPERTAMRFEKCFGTAVRTLYGTTETGGISVSLADGRTPPRGFVGPSMSDVEVELRPHSGAADEGTGMLYVRSTSMMAGYLDENGLDESPLANKFFQTGDLARLDADGGIHLLGRETEVINVSGMKVIPCEVEQVIAAVPGVLDVKVYPGRRKSGDQFVQAALVLEPEVREEAIREQCAEQLIYYKRPERLHLLDALPRSPAGKVLVQQLP